jgi:hypothetical protein
LPPLIHTNNKNGKCGGAGVCGIPTHCVIMGTSLIALGLRIGSGVRASFVLKEIMRRIKSIASCVGQLAYSSSPIIDPLWVHPLKHTSPNNKNIPD